MKKYYLFIALAIVAGLTVSCKNNKNAEADAEVVEVAKTILADDVLATLDELAQTYTDETGTFAPGEIICSSLTEEEKLIKPDYLLEASQANELVTKSQKLNALAMLLVERPVRIAFGMPTEETDEVIARFAADVNDPVSFDDEMNLTPAEKTKMAYKAHKERGDIADFWQFGFAAQTGIDYLISKNQDVFFRNISEEQYATFLKKITAAIDAVRILAEYDSEVKQVWDIFDADRAIVDDIFTKKIEDGRKFYSERKDVFATRRAALLK